MGQNHDQIGPGGAQRRNMRRGGLGHTAARQMTVQMNLIPSDELRRQEAEDTDPELVFDPGAADDAPTEHETGLHERFVLQRCAPTVADRVGADHGKLGRREGVQQMFKAEIELVIAQRGGIIAKKVHRRDHRMRLIAALPCPEIGQRRALQEIPVIEKKAVSRFRPGLTYQRRGASQPEWPVAGIRIIIEGQDVGVQIRGFQQANPEMRIFRFLA